MKKDVDQFFDTNVLLYLLSSDSDRANRSEALLAEGGVVSVQVLNEFASVARRKLTMTWPEVTDILTQIRALCRVDALTADVHTRGIELAQRYGFSVYDAMIVASALIANCQKIYTEDLQNGQIIEDSLKIQNPFSPT
jgi:predicted nucleic acid-binding protein